MVSFKQITIQMAAMNQKEVKPNERVMERGSAVPHRKNSRRIWYALGYKLRQRLSHRQLCEISRLKSYAWRVVITLLVLLVASILFIVLQLAEIDPKIPPAAIVLVSLCVAAGLAGSVVSTLISVADRYAYGWELEDGTKVPRATGTPDRFNQRMVPWFIIRPFLGSMMGLVIYVALSAGVYSGTINPSSNQSIVSGSQLTFFALLAGLFAKKFLDSLRSAFAAFVGADKGKGGNSRDDRK
jgi:hypothetical protein